jgi:ferredoxin--NADP+ reductase
MRSHVFAQLSSNIARRPSRRYNAVVDSIHYCHDKLMILRVRPDAGVPRFMPGQFTMLGLGSWEPSVGESATDEPAALTHHRLLKRAYSISCRMLDAECHIERSVDSHFLEFYITLVDDFGGKGLTPRLFNLREGARLFCDDRPRGRYTLAGVPNDSNVLFAATGTGEAPHNAMIAELLARGHLGRIVSTVCVRHKRDLGYLKAHRRLESLFPHYRYLALTTRELANLEPIASGYVGKQYLQQYLESGQLERDAGCRLAPGDTHVFLCGNPAMIGARRIVKTAKPSDDETHDGMLRALRNRGFRIDDADRAANVHFEQYW